MSTEKNKEPALSEQQKQSLTEENVVEYIEDHPDLFNRHPHIVTSLRLSDTNRGTVSLVERHQQKQREKIHVLEEEITHLLSIANHNERLFTLYSAMYLRLLDCTSAEELLDCLYKATTELLSLSDLKIWLADGNNLGHQSLVQEDCQEILKNRLSKEEFYFGRIQQSEQLAIFGQPTTGSVVFIKLEHLNKTLGFLAISSEDADHFDPRMDTLLLGQFRILVAKLLSQQLVIA